MLLSIPTPEKQQCAELAQAMITLDRIKSILCLC